MDLRSVGMLETGSWKQSQGRQERQWENAMPRAKTSLHLHLHDETPEVLDRTLGLCDAIIIMPKWDHGP